MAPPTIAIIAAGAMGSPIAKILATSGVTVLTNLDGRSETTRRRARDAGMVDVPWSDIALRASCILSIVPPAEAGNLATRYLESRSAVRTHATKVPQPIFVDCNAVGPTTVQEIASKFDGSDVRFADGCIIGFPPSHDSSPTFYFAANAPDVSALKELENLGQYGLKLATLTGDGAGVGDASALKMSYGGILKGITGLFTTMVLAANASSSATTTALLNELAISQPSLLQRSTQTIPDMFPKAYRWVDEMREISTFVSGPMGDVHRGLASVFEIVEKSVNGDGNARQVLEKFVKDAEAVLKDTQ